MRAFCSRRRARPPDAAAAGAPTSARRGVSNLCQSRELHAGSERRLPAHLHARSGPAAGGLREGRGNIRLLCPTIWTFDRLEARRRVIARGMYSYTDNSTIIQTFTDRGQPDPTSWTARRPGNRRRPRCPAAPTQPNTGTRRSTSRAGRSSPGAAASASAMKNYPDGHRQRDHASTGCDERRQRAGKASASGRAAAPTARPASASSSATSTPTTTSPTSCTATIRTMPRYCERVRECGCLNHRTCTAIHLDGRHGGTGPITNAADSVRLRAPAADHSSTRTS